jgi:hypothetical protein
MRNESRIHYSPGFGDGTPGGVRAGRPTKESLPREATSKHRNLSVAVFRASKSFGLKGSVGSWEKTPLLSTPSLSHPNVRLPEIESHPVNGIQKVSVTGAQLQASHVLLPVTVPNDRGCDGGVHAAPHCVDFPAVLEVMDRR